MERRRRLADLLAVPARELLPHRLDHLPPARRRLQRPRHVLAELAQAKAAAACARRRRIDHHTLVRQMVGERVALGAPAGEGAHRRRLRGRLLRRKLVFRGAGRHLLELERQLVNQPLRPLRPLPIDLALELGDPKLLRGDQRHVLRGFRLRDRQLRRDFEASRTLGDQRRLEGRRVVGKRFGSGIHADAANHSSRDSRRLKTQMIPCFFSLAGCAPSRSACALRPPCQLRIPPVDAFEHVGHLTRRNRDDALLRGRPDELPAVEPLRIQ